MQDAAEVTLHDYYRSSASFRVRIALNLKQVTYQSIPHHLRRGEQRHADYLKLNPQGLVPTLQRGPEVLRQSLALLEYLEEAYPQPPILPTAPVDRARVRALAQIICCDIHPINNLRVLQYLRGTLGQDEEGVRRWAVKWIGDGFDAYERVLEEGDRADRFSQGATPTIADICLIPQVVNAQNFQFDLAPYPSIRQIFDAAVALPAFERALPQNQPDAE
jgi:maleylacetoacetate isomerase